MVQYVFRDVAVIKNMKKADPQKIGEALAVISDGVKGKMTPQHVVEAASNTRHVLHKHFEWDDAKAGAAFRLDQARSLINSVRIVDDETEEKTPAFISIADKSSGVSYRRVEEVTNSVDLQYSLMKAAERELEAFERRFKMLKDICELVRDLRETLAARRAEHEARSAAA